MNVHVILCSVLKNISETIVALVTKEGNTFRSLLLLNECDKSRVSDEYDICSMHVEYS